MYCSTKIITNTNLASPGLNNSCAIVRQIFSRTIISFLEWSNEQYKFLWDSTNCISFSSSSVAQPMAFNGIFSRFTKCRRRNVNQNECVVQQGEVSYWCIHYSCFQNSWLLQRDWLVWCVNCQASAALLRLKLSMPSINRVRNQKCLAPSSVE